MKKTAHILPATVRSKILDHTRSNHSGAENVLVVYRDGDADGKEIADYYAAARSIPASNVLAVSFPAGIGTKDTEITIAECAEIRSTIRTYIAQQDLSINFAVVCGYWPYQTDTGGVFRSSQYYIFYTPKSTTEDNSQATCFSKDVDSYYKDPDQDPATFLYIEPFVYHETGVGNRMWEVCQSGNQLGDKNTGQFPMSRVHLLIDDKDKNKGKALTGDIHPFFLSFPPVSENDTTFGAGSTHVDYIKRQIDATLTAEGKEYNNFGTVVLSGSSSYGGLGFAIDAALELDFCNIPYTNLYLEHINADAYESSAPRDSTALYPGLLFKRTQGGVIRYYFCTKPGVTASEEPAYSTTVGALTYDGTVPILCAYASIADNFAEGTTSTVEATNVTWAAGAYSDVMFQAIGDEAYFSTTRQPQALDDYAYRTGAVVIVGQSYGAVPNPQVACDYEYDTGADLNTKTATSAKDANVGITITNALGGVATVWTFTYTGDGTTATVEQASGVFVFKVDGSTVATLDVSAMTLRAATAYLRANITAGWAVSVSHSSVSRVSQAIRAGAVFAIGANREPFTNGMIRTKNFIEMLWNGICMGDICITLQDAILNNGFYGDPLYCPFRWRRQR